MEAEAKSKPNSQRRRTNSRKERGTNSWRERGTNSWRENQESILVRLAAIEQLLGDGKGLHLPGSLPSHAITVDEGDHDDGEDGGDSYSQRCRVPDDRSNSSDDEDSYSQHRIVRDTVVTDNLYSPHDHSYGRDDMFRDNVRNPHSFSPGQRPAQPSPPWRPPPQYYSTPTHYPYSHRNYEEPYSHPSFKEPQQPYRTHSSLPIDSGRGHPPKCHPIKPRKNAKILPSSSICKDKLADPAAVVSKYSKLCCESKAPTLATKLAREAFFGDHVLAACTVMGCRDYH